MSQAIIIIPVRWGSSRFPGKPLAVIKGKTMLQRVWEIAKSVKNASSAWIAADDERIIRHAGEIGGQAVLTSPDCANGTERVLDAVKKLNLNSEIYINLQGDAPLTPSWIIEALIEKMSGDPQCLIATPAARLKSKNIEKMRQMANEGRAGGTTVVFDKTGRALYFSKSLIPYLRDSKAPDQPVFKHLGIYAYTEDALEKWVSLPEGVFEQAEQLEQLRALEHRLPIEVVIVDTRGRTLWSVDNPQDIGAVESILEKEGELNCG
ncbi:MAG: 3-deoxy-manno-octulosonate cytidylyltransferase [Elusimicrobia bacterium]|nr:3-deoxy-manno-octulosonate cytidylyltransferase [Elusimicrobiota bacterium]